MGAGKKTKHSKYWRGFGATRDLAMPHAWIMGILRYTGELNLVSIGSTPI